MTTQWLGRFALGQELPLCLRCTLAGAPDTPSTHPAVEVRDASAAAYRGRVPADGQGEVLGLFRGPLQLGAAFTPGRYAAVFRWADSGGADRVEVHEFQVVAGGSADGAVTFLHPVDRPQATYLLYGTDAGKLARGRNPR